MPTNNFRVLLLRSNLMKYSFNRQIIIPSINYSTCGCFQATM